MTESEWHRWLAVCERARSRIKSTLKLSDSEINRRLIGFDEPDEFVTVEDIDFFFNGGDDALLIVTELPPATTDVRAEDTQPELMINKKNPLKKIANGE